MIGLVQVPLCTKQLKLTVNRSSTALPEQGSRDLLQALFTIQTMVSSLAPLLLLS